MIDRIPQTPLFFLQSLSKYFLYTGWQLFISRWSIEIHFALQYSGTNLDQTFRDHLQQKFRWIERKKKTIRAVLTPFISLVQEYLNRRKMTEFGSLALIDMGQDEDENGKKIRLPGVRQGDRSSRHFKPEILVTSVRFSPTGKRIKVFCSLLDRSINLDLKDAHGLHVPPKVC